MWGWNDGDFTKFLLVVLGVGVVIGMIFCKFIPWLLSHIRIEWVS